MNIFACYIVSTACSKKWLDLLVIIENLLILAIGLIHCK